MAILPIDNSTHTVTVCQLVPDLCSFIVNDKNIVTAAYLLKENTPEIFLPVEKTQISLRNFINKDNVFVLLKDSVLDFEANQKISVPNIKCETLNKLITEHHFDLEDIIHLCATANNLLKHNFPSFDSTFKLPNTTKILLKLLPELKKTTKLYELIIPQHITTQLKLNFDYINPDSYYTAGLETVQYFCGYLTVNQKSGFLVLSGGAGINVPCFIIHDTPSTYTAGLSKCLNRFVLISQAKIVSEVFKPHARCSYLMIELNNIQVIYEHMNKIEYPVGGGNFECIKIKVIYRSPVKYCKGRERNYYSFNVILYCDIEVNFGQVYKFQIYLVLKEKHLKSYVLFNAGDVYLIKTKDQWFLKQLNQIKTNEKIDTVNLPQQAYFELIPNEYSAPEQLITVPEILSKPRDKIKTYNFEGVITKRVDCNWPNDMERLSLTSFGIQGKIQFVAPIDYLQSDCFCEYVLGHRGLGLYVQDELDSKKVGVYFWLNNMEDRQTNLGCIPGMRVQIYFVTHRRESKFKETWLTQIKPIRFEAYSRFNSANEFKHTNFWGKLSYLSTGLKILPSYVLWGQTITITIIELSLLFNCLEKKSNLQMELNLMCTDPMGRFYVTTDQTQILIKLLDFSKSEWRIFSSGFSKVKEYNYKIDESRDDKKKKCENVKNHTETKEDRALKQLFSVKLTSLINKFNHKNIHRFDLRCKRITDNNCSKSPNWFAFDAIASKYRYTKQEKTEIKYMLDHIDNTRDIFDDSEDELISEADNKNTIDFIEDNPTTSNRRKHVKYTLSSSDESDDNIDDDYHNYIKLFWRHNKPQNPESIPACYNEPKDVNARPWRFQELEEQEDIH